MIISWNVEILSVRSCGTSTSLSRVRKYYGGKVPVTAVKKFIKREEVQFSKEKSLVYVGPTVEGPDAEYVKVVSGKVDKRKPFFAGES